MSGQTGLGPPLHINTPLLESLPLSQLAGCKVYVKLDNAQPPGSFKIRGIGHRIQKAVAAGCKKLVASSGGNAGLAAAYAARKLGIPITIYIPNTTPQFMLDKVRAEQATVIVHGSVWDQANEMALKAAEDPECTYIHPFDHPDTWTGHATLIEEVAASLPGPPDAVVTVVGGGGLLCGLAQGLDAVGWKNVPLVAIETKGAESYHESIKANKLVTLPTISSIAKSLGSLTVTARALQYYHERPILSEVVTDKDAVSACLRFADDHRMLVEPACGAALSGVYSNILQRLHKEGALPKLDTVVVVVCGGNIVNLALLEQWKTQFGV